MLKVWQVWHPSGATQSLRKLRRETHTRRDIAVMAVLYPLLDALSEFGRSRLNGGGYRIVLAVIAFIELVVRLFRGG